MVIQQNPNMSTLQLLKLKTNSGMRSWTLQLSACTIEIERRTNVFLDSWLSFPKWLLDLLRPRYEQSKKTETNWEFWFWPTQCVWKNMKQIWWSTCLPIWGTCRVCVCACQQRVSKSIVPLIHTKYCKSKASSLGARSQGVRTYSKN